MGGGATVTTHQGLLQFKRHFHYLSYTHSSSCNNTHDGLVPIELVPCCFGLEACVSIDLSNSKASHDQFLVKANGSSLFRWIYCSKSSIQLFMLVVVFSIIYFCNVQFYYFIQHAWRQQRLFYFKTLLCVCFNSKFFPWASVETVNYNNVNFFHQWDERCSN